MTEDQKVGIIANAIGWVVYGEDGREQEDGAITLTAAEVALAHKAARLVFKHLEDFEDD